MRYRDAPIDPVRLFYEDAIKLSVKKFSNRYRISVDDAKFLKKKLLEQLKRMKGAS